MHFILFTVIFITNIIELYYLAKEVGVIRKLSNPIKFLTAQK